MDTAAYLTNQGWRGDGHALHHSGRGIAKPILVSQKQDVLGIGKKKHDAHADQWWARAFDATLKAINSTKDTATGKTDGISLGEGAQALQMVGKGGAKWVGQRGLYSNFVRGEILSGTLTPEEERKPNGNEQGGDRGANEDGKPERTAAREKKRQSKQRQQQEETVLHSVKITNQADTQGLMGNGVGPTQNKADDWETKQERRQRRKERRARRALKEGAINQKLPAQTKAGVDEDLRSKNSRKQKKEKLRLAARIESAVQKTSS